LRGYLTIIKKEVRAYRAHLFWFIGNRRDSLEHLAVKRKAKLISPYIWRDATANPKEPLL
jgi:hypothetical protein